LDISINSSLPSKYTSEMIRFLFSFSQIFGAVELSSWFVGIQMLVREDSCSWA
jgi:hypothetical protein